MREWNFKPGDKLTITLAADARITPTEYCDDQIWELVLSAGSVAALTVQSTLGLRARSLRIFPRFTEGDLDAMDPSSFHRPPTIANLYPNFLAIRYAPFPELDVEAEYWVPQSDALTGRIKLSNHSLDHRLIRIDWIGQLTPTDGQRMAIAEIDAVQLLWGKTELLHPTIYLTGGAEQGNGSFPALTRTLELPPGASQELTWSHAACPDRDLSFKTARQVAARRWDAESARMELLNAGSLQIYTGNPDWDFIFTISQNLANGLLVGPGPRLPSPSFVLSRQPDLGYSMRGDGTDYDYLWNGQSTFEAYYLASLILPGSAPQIQGIIHNFLATQQDNGFIDWRPGMAGQRSRILATPLLSTLTWRLFEHTRDREMLHNTYDPLMRFFNLWLSPEKDRDGDQFPEWDHPLQMGFEDHPLFSRWHDGSAGIDITAAESPAMGAMLTRELRSLMQIASTIGRTESMERLQAASDALSAAMLNLWSPEDAIYHDIDRDAHHSSPGRLLGMISGSGTLPIECTFDRPSRVLVHLRTGGETIRQAVLFIHGVGISGQPRVERISGDQFKWQPGRGVLTGDRVYTSIDKIEIQNLAPTEEISLFEAGFYLDNQSALLPLWAGIPDHQQASSMIEKAIANPQRFWRPYGIPAWNISQQVSYGNSDTNLENSRAVHIPWNAMIGEGLIAYGYRSLAAELVSRLMAGIVQNYHAEGSFRRYYHSETGAGIGERNILHGLAPLGLFMQTLGVSMISPHQVKLSGFNPFPWPVTVKYRGISILRQKERTVVVFPDGQLLNIDDPADQIVSLE
jgi:hypothetical protein